MKKSFFGLIILFVLLTTYTPKFNFNINLNINKIKIENNSIIKSDVIKRKLSFLYEENLFFLNIEDIEKNLKKINFIESFSIKKVYPNTLKLNIVEKKPIAILHDKKEIFYISDKGELINFTKIEVYKNLPTVFGNGKSFLSLYKDLKNINFPLEMIKSFYFFESGRWDLLMLDEKLIKLPIKDHLFSLKNFMSLEIKSKANNYKIFDYRIKDQLILN